MGAARCSWPPRWSAGWSRPTCPSIAAAYGPPCCAPTPAASRDIQQRRRHHTIPRPRRRGPSCRLLPCSARVSLYPSIILDGYDGIDAACGGVVPPGWGGRGPVACQWSRPTSRARRPQEPRSRSSEYGGDAFCRGTDRWEFHILFCSLPLCPAILLILISLQFYSDQGKLVDMGEFFVRVTAISSFTHLCDVGD